MLIERLAVIAALLLFPFAASAAEPVRRIAIYVEPFCRSAQAADGTPQVGVGKQYNDPLASNKREDIPSNSAGNNSNLLGAGPRRGQSGSGYAMEILV